MSDLTKAAIVLTGALATATAAGCSTGPGLGTIKDVVTADNPVEAVKNKTTKPIDDLKEIMGAFSPEKAFQKALNARGCDAGKADGDIGAGTLAAHKRLEAANGTEIAKTATAVATAKVGCP